MVLDEPGRPLRLADLPDPAPGPTDVLVEVHACVVCRTALHIRDREVRGSRLPGPCSAPSPASSTVATI